MYYIGVSGILFDLYLTATWSECNMVYM